MNLLKKISILFFLLFLLSYDTLWCQTYLNVGANISAGNKAFPVNGKLGLGASLEYVRAISKKGSLRLYIGYDWFNKRFPGIDSRTIQDSIKAGGINGYDMSLIPLRVGYEYFLCHDAAFVYMEAGVSHIVTQYKSANIPGNSFTYAVGTGYKFMLKNMHYLQASVYYNHNRLNEYVKRNYISLRIAYGLNL